ncbi:GILT-like protein 1, partial [Oppia nitens]|uniref:GILT-like protein 1 n=1 Tax=Oppia nitens TaxID=1686743 RepID=UPI0023DA7081
CYYFQLFICQLFLVINSHHISNRLSVYYESICPDSRRFFLNQLMPAYEKLGQYLDVDLIPFGNANVSYPNYDRKPSFRCQHGPDECYGNKAQACVLDITKMSGTGISGQPSTTLQYIACMFSAGNWRQTQVTAKQCAETVHLNWTQLSECIDGSHGDRLMVAHSHRTFNLEPQHTFIPWIIIDGQQSNDIQERTQINLVQYLCDNYHSKHEPKLAECSEKTLQSIQSQLSSAMNLKLSIISIIIATIMALIL